MLVSLEKKQVDELDIMIADTYFWFLFVVDKNE